MHHLIQALASVAQSLVTSFGHWGIFIAMVIESACIPLPSEVIMLYGGFQAALGHLDFWKVVIAGVVGNVVGSIVIYWIGASGGRKIVEKFGKYLLIRPSHIEKGDRWFSKHGEWAVLVGRNLPVVRTFISLPAGIARMNFAKFTLYTVIGSIPWDLALCFGGYKLGKNWDVVEPYIKPIQYLIEALIVVGIVYFFIRAFRSKKARSV